MLFNSGAYLLFFPVVMLFFYLLPSKDRKKWLLLCSYFFYSCWNIKFLLLLILSTISTFLTGIILEKCRNSEKSNRYKKIVLFFCVALNISLLVVFKYSNFIIQNVNRVTSIIGGVSEISYVSIMLPVGISFYTFQAVGYICDVYREKIRAERDIVTYSLFVSFFPQVCAGPIERASNMLKQYNNIINIDVTWLLFKERLEKGIPLILLGCFEKIVIADRASILVDAVYGEFSSYSAIDIIFATIIYGIQIYCDFDGYSNIAIGSAALVGIDLMENFKRPYLATNIKDFWSRWHISLTSWFTDYLYIPLGGNRKGEIRKYLNIFIVFAVSGLWHGASWNFMVWGMIHGFLLVLYNIFHKKGKEKQVELKCGTRILKAIITFLFADFAWLFFRAPNLSSAIEMIKKIVFSFDCYLSFPNEIFSYAEMCVLLASVLLLFVVDILHENNVCVMKKIFRQEMWFYILVMVIIIMTLFTFGVYGGTYDVSKFIYFQF